MTEQSGGLSVRAIPTCKDCKQQHYNFKPCPPRQDIKPPIEWRSNDEGWGDRMHELKRLGENSFVRRGEYDR